MSSKFNGYREKYIMYHVQSQRPLKKCTCRGMGVVVCTWTISFPLEMKTFSLLSTAHLLFYLLNFEFPFIMTKIVPF